MQTQAIRQPDPERFVAVCVPGHDEDDPAHYFVHDRHTRTSEPASGRLEACRRARELNAKGAQ